MATSTSPADRAAMSSVADWNVLMVHSMSAGSNRPSASATHMGRMSSVGSVPRRTFAGLVVSEEASFPAAPTLLASVASCEESHPVRARGKVAHNARKPARERFMRWVQSGRERMCPHYQITSHADVARGVRC